MSNTEYSELVTFKVSDKMYKQVKAAAEREYLTVSQWVRKLIREALEKK
jgi:hypothetical protein